MRKVCLLNWGSVRSERKRDKNNHYVLAEEESIYAISINTQVIIQNCALSLARYLGLSADNHLDGHNGCQ